MITKTYDVWDQRHPYGMGDEWRANVRHVGKVTADTGAEALAAAKAIAFAPMVRVVAH